MEKAFQLMMVKHMLTNRGFTLVETLFVLFIICMLSLLTMTLHLPNKNNQVIIQEITEFLNQAKLEAIVSKKTVTVQFLKDMVLWKTTDKEKNYQLSENTYFDSYKMTFNSAGHIKTAKTVTYHTLQQDFQFVYQVGSGCFYVQ